MLDGKLATPFHVALAKGLRIYSLLASKGGAGDRFS